ncbi:unnamed protein product [Brachionus calyciflorus]|uniref:E3 ubiquitin-protein ligase n=1 Tax=Brachionus calyciflorus TaxID=104777 RepID=A0A813S3T6_9BILA|nr:unnamed protein product [Brachionus calyciflorus]
MLASDKIHQFSKFTNQNIDLIVLNSSITELSNVDCIVNCTGPCFEHYGGVSKAITEAAGPKILKEYKNYNSQFGELEAGIVHDTHAFNLNQYKYILHVVTPKHKTYLEMIYSNLFTKCFNELNLESIAVPLIGTGLARRAINDCVNSLIESIRYLKNLTKNIKIYIVNNNPDQIKECLEILKNFLNPEINDNDKDKLDECPICLDNVSDAKKLNKCGHIFCKSCIDKSFNVKQVCPLCNMVYGVNEGNQPNGTMNIKILNLTLPGYDKSVNTIEISYLFPSGVQQANHPNPGQRYHGTQRVAYLPNDNDGKKVLGLLQKAFEKKLLFTIGQSRTTNRNNVVTWNDIHHKTSIDGGPANFGYPDNSYIQRVLAELADKGIQ